MDDMQEKVDKHQEDADHEYKDLVKLQVCFQRDHR